MSTAFEIYRDTAGDFRWRAKAAENGLTLAASSEGYARKEDASKSLFRILKAISVGCTIQVNDRPLDVSALAEGVHEDEDGAT